MVRVPRKAGETAKPERSRPAGNSLEERPDAEWLRRLHLRDERALTELMRLHTEQLRRRALAYLGDESEAMDVVMDAFIRLWDRPPLPAPDTNLGGYLATAVRNASLNVIRGRDVRARVHESFAAADESPAMGVPPAAPDEDLNRTEMVIEVQRAIGELPDAVRRVALLRWGQRNPGTTEEIAATLGISSRTVQNYLSLAIRILRERFAEEKG
jgi:RNA polymerase sigma-70 factor, ECF subfamily